MLLEALRRPNPVVSWAAQSSPILTAMLSDHFKAVRHQVLDDHRYDPKNRLLSEMGLCGAVYNLRLPPGYHVVSGTVYVKRLKDFALDHKFAMKGNDVICVTAGQFVDPNNETMQKGERIEMLKGENPNHVFVDGELAVLHGTRRQIERSHGLHYLTESIEDLLS